ncbi:MAG: hypothetical protein JNL73_14820 [Anaerolineales bacterium]|nr:hypothetical protein [Anaerolineales bacterium]
MEKATSSPDPHHTITLGTILRTLDARERQGLLRRLLTAVVVRQGRVIDIHKRSI